MFSCDFKSKLAKLNSRLFVDDSSRRWVAEDFYVSALCHRRFKRVDHLDTSQLTGSTKLYADALNSGELPEHICGVPTGQVPEHDLFDLERGTLLARGWRSILLILAKQNLIDLHKARKVFGCAGLGEDEYDRTPLNVRLQWARDERFYKTAKQELASYAK